MVSPELMAQEHKIYQPNISYPKPRFNKGHNVPLIEVIKYHFLQTETIIDTNYAIEQLSSFQQSL